MIDILRADDAVTALLRGPQPRTRLVDSAAPGWLHPLRPVFGAHGPTSGGGTGPGEPEADPGAEEPSDPPPDNPSGRAGTGTP